VSEFAAAISLSDMELPIVSFWLGVVIPIPTFPEL